jgi:hypothetical protein
LSIRNFFQNVADYFLPVAASKPEDRYAAMTGSNKEPYGEDWEGHKTYLKDVPAPEVAAKRYAAMTGAGPR